MRNFILSKNIAMTLSEFTATLTESAPPTTIHVLAQALWFDANQDWEAAHDIAQKHEGLQPYDKLHAYLHRKEGDTWNANYWYRRAKTTLFTGSFASEWEMLAREFLAM
jgi:hypothetical protein